jgi:tellurite resistance protein
LGIFDKVLGKESGEIKLNKPEAFAAVAVATIASDGNISPEELQRTVINLSTIQFFRKYDLKDLSNTLNKVAGILNRRGSGPLMEAVKATLSHEHLETAFFVAADLILADGIVEAEEKKFLEELQHTLQIDEAIALKIVDVALIKNRA